jgi:hypothetical protein
MTSKFKVGLALALGTFIIGVAAASLRAVHKQRLTEQILSIDPVNVPQTASHPVGWRKIYVAPLAEDGQSQLAEKFSFYLPPEMKPEAELDANIEYLGPHQSFESKTLNGVYLYVEKWRNEELWRGRVSCDLLMQQIADEPGSQSSEVETGGKRARQIAVQAAKSGLAHTRICFPDAGAGMVLTIYVEYEKGRAVDAAKIISSIEFL